MTQYLKKELILLLNTYFDIRFPLLIKVMRDTAFEQFSDNEIIRPNMTDLSNLKSILMSQIEEAIQLISAKSNEIWIKECQKKGITSPPNDQNDVSSTKVACE